MHPVSDTGRRRDAPLVEGEYLFTGEDFERIARILHGDTGIHMPAAKASLMYSRLVKRLRALGLRSFRDYCDLLTSAECGDERRAMMTALTTNVTRFFREPHHFDDLRTSVIPELARAARQGGRVRLWSAGCSNGSEPYSIALCLLADLPQANELDVRILASDIDPEMVAMGREGVYAADALEPIPAPMRRFLEKQPDGLWRMADPVRELISFRELNLFSQWPFRGQFQVIFCRNVAIYFEPSDQELLWERFAERMTPGARLYIGHSERVGSARFTSCGLTAYRLAGGRA